MGAVITQRAHFCFAERAPCAGAMYLSVQPSQIPT
jgi:hypothetical protein